jgi:tetratricopeptide (TPR) repeat protein
VSEDRARLGTRSRRVRQPFPGARPFRRAEAGRFFGRAAEAEQIRSLWLTERTVVLAGPSAVGKTSLLLAGVLSTLIAGGAADLLSVGRLTVGPVGADFAPSDSGFVPTLLRSWAGGGHRPSASATTVLEFLAERVAKAEGRGDHRPILAVIDQFEDAFAVPPGVPGREQLLGQLVAAVTDLPALHLLLLIRQSALARFTDDRRFSQLRPRIVSLRPLAHDEAVQAIAGPASVSRVPLASGVAEQIVEDLRTVTFTDSAGNERVERVERVEPLHLQITGRRLWASLPPKAEIVTGDLVRSYGGVDESLIDYYDAALCDLTSRFGVSEDRLRDWIQRTFVTELGGRASAQLGYLTMDGLPTEVLGELAARHILTAEHRASGVWYQLSHDRLAYTVSVSNRSRDTARDAGADPAGAPPSARHQQATAEAALGRGDLLAAERNITTAAAEYKAAGEWRRVADARVLQADIASAKGDPAEAERYLRTAESIFSMLEDRYSSARVLTAIAKLRFAAGDYDEATDLNRQAVERAPGDVAALTGLAYAQWQSGSPADAEATFDQALRWNWNSALALVGRGQVRADLGRYEYALDDLDRALRLPLAREAEADARSARALALAGLGRLPEAERELSATFQLDSDRARTRLRAGRIAAILGHRDEVQAEIERALSGQPSLSSVERESAKRIMESIL